MLRSNDYRHRGFGSWWLYLAVLAVGTTAGVCRSMGAENFSSDASSSSSPRKTLGQEFGSPSELAWQAWLLVENKHGGQSILDSSNILRRITPKSIFIAPELVSCPSGFSSDGKGVCKPDPIKIDEEAQKQFWLKRLNAHYGKLGNNRGKKPEEAAGPLQINIPVSLSPRPILQEATPARPQLQVQTHPQQQSQRPEQVAEQEVVVSADPVTNPTGVPYRPPEQLVGNDKSQDTVAVINDTKNEQKVTSEIEETELSGGTSNSPVPKNEEGKAGQTVPVAEIIEEVNDAYPGLLDYKEPVDHQVSTDTRYPSGKTGDESDFSDDTSPAVVPLVSPTKRLSTTSSQMDTKSVKVDPRDESSAGLGSDHNENTTVESTENETKSEPDSSIQTVAPLDMQTAIDPVSSIPKNTEEPYSQDKKEDDEASYAGEETQTEQESVEHEEYDEPDEQDDFGESEDELLKPGEAGMMISSKNQDLIRPKGQKQQPSTSPDVDAPTSTTLVDSTTVPTIATADLQDAFEASESTFRTEATSYTREDMASTHPTEFPSTIVTTESSAEDTTMFTILPVSNRDSMKTTTTTTTAHGRWTQLPVTTTTEGDYGADRKETFEPEKYVATEAEVTISTQGSYGMTTAYDRIQPAHPARATKAPFALETLEEVVSSTELPTFPDSRRSSVPERGRPRPTAPAGDDEPILLKNGGNIPAEFEGQMPESPRPPSPDWRRVPSLSLNDEASYVRFPGRAPETRPEQRGYVRFPSDEVNSIHGQDGYKERLLSSFRARDDLGANSVASTKSSVPARVKQWRPPPARADRQQQGPAQRQRQQNPMLLKFWAKMPLFKYDSFYPTTAGGARLNARFAPATSPAPPRGAGRHKKMARDVDRLPAVGG